MADENKKKKGILSKALAAKKWIKILGNPITWYVLFGIFILFLIVGIIAIITALPGTISGKFTEMITGLLGKQDDPTRYDVTDDEVRDMAKYLESMGYDVENYGFVEEIKRTDDAIEDGKYKDDKPSRGEITKVTSKYLEAYIGEEKKLYKIAPENYYQADIIEDYYLMQAINNKKINDENLRLYYYYQLKGTDITTLPLETQQKFEQAKNKVAEDDNAKKATMEEMQKIEEEYNNSIANASDRMIGAGMIVLTGEAKIEENKKHKWFRKVLGETVYDFEVDVDKRKLNLKISEKEDSEDGWKIFWDFLKTLIGLKRARLYSVDLEQYLSKYGKPSEFTLALHLATQAPDFVYKLATSTSTDTKVYLDMWERKELYQPIYEKEDVTGATWDPEGTKPTEFKEGEYITWEQKLGWLKNHGGIKKRLLECLELDWVRNYIINRKIQALIAENIWQYGQSAAQIDWSPVAYKWYYTRLDRLKNIKDETTSVKQFLEAMYTTDPKNKYIDCSLGPYLDEHFAKDSLMAWDFGTFNCVYYDIEELERLTKALKKEITVATPYITKVVQHWYRNQYFTMEGEELKKAKAIANSFLDNLKVRIEAVSKNANVEINDAKTDIEAIRENSAEEKINIDGIELKITKSVKQVIEILQEKSNQLINDNFTDEIAKENMAKYLKTKIRSIAENYGTTYKKIKPEDKWISLKNLKEPEEGGITLSERETVVNIMETSYWLVKPSKDPKYSKDIQQIHNPRFEDNSQFIRKSLKEKYIIYDGVSRPEEDRLLGAKTYIQGKTALESLVAMLNKATTSDQYLKYTKRDVIEFMQDYAFDLDQIQETAAEKDLENIMPAYVPYTPWPSEYEKADSVWTKMIYKTDTGTALKAPADCIITHKGEIAEIGILDESGVIKEYVYVCSDEDDNGNKLTDLVINEGTHKKGDNIGTATPKNKLNGISLISIKLQMLSHTKQKIDITTHMNVKNKELKDVEGEKDAIYSIMDYAMTYDQKQIYYSDFFAPIASLLNWFRFFPLVSFDPEVQLYAQECLALLNTAFNRIASPYCKDKSLKDINFDEMFKANDDNLATSNSKAEFEKFKDEINIDTVINLALRGSDKTKEGTILGATAHIRVWEEKVLANNKKDGYKTIHTELPDVNLKIAIGGSGLYLPNEEYKKYQEYYVNNKVSSIFIQLNEQKEELNKQKEYSAGYEKYKISRTEKPGEDFKKCFEYVKDTIYAAAESDCITSIIVTGIKEEIKEEEEKQFIDTFRIKVNSNVTVDVTIKYNCTEEGKILYDTIEYTTEEVERL